MSLSVDSALEDWDDIATEEWPALLVGNGASIAVWPQFSYTSLFEHASLADEDVDLFDALRGTRNFEVALDALRVSSLVCDRLGHDATAVTDRYDSIKGALIAAVNDVHVPWTRVRPEIFSTISRALLDYESIYSTNYDLIVYWSLMQAAEPRDFGDYFWQPNLEFDLSNVQPRWDMTLVHYLHGGLHIYRTPDGRTVKRSPPPNATLLDLLGQPFQDVDLPLFVSEGTSGDKMSVIRSSDYLSFAYRKLTEEDRPLVIFGSSLSDQDAHLTKAIASHKDRPLAVSVRPGQTLDIISTKTDALRRLPETSIRFFDSTTHPLGDPCLRVTAHT